MRVLFVNENIDGHASTHLHLRRALQSRPDITPVFLDVPPAGLGRKLLSAPVPGLARLDLDLQPLRSRLAHSAWTRRHLERYVRDVDVVHAFTQNGVLLSAGLLRRIPVVLGTDCTGEMNAYALPYRAATRFTRWSVRLSKVFERRVQASADVIVATGETVARSLREQYGVPAQRIRVFPYGITAPRFDQPAAPGTRGLLPGSQPRLVFVGRTLRAKGGDRLLRLHQERFAGQCELVLVTRERVPAARNVTVIDDLTPGDSRLWTILRSGAVFAFPSRIDQQPNAVIEAMAAGLPVIAYPISSIADMVEHGVSGLFPAGDDDRALADAIEQLLQDVNLRERMGAAGRDRYERLLSAERTVECLADALQDAVDLHHQKAS